MCSQKSGEVDQELVATLSQLVGVSVPLEERADALERLEIMLEFWAALTTDRGGFRNPDVHFDPSWSGMEQERT